MGDRYIITVTCKGCGYTNFDVYYAPTCGFLIHICSYCGTEHDLEELTGISYEDASNLDEIERIVKEVAQAYPPGTIIEV